MYFFSILRKNSSANFKYCYKKCECANGNAACEASEWTPYCTTLPANWPNSACSKPSCTYTLDTQNAAVAAAMAACPTTTCDKTHTQTDVDML